MIVHTILYVADQNRSTNFYSNVLGMTPTLDVRGMTEFKLSDKHILVLKPERGINRLLGERLPDPAQGNGLPRAELYFRVDEPESFLQRAVDSGTKEISAIQPRDGGDRAGYVLDFDGHVLGFATSLAARKEESRIPQPTLETARLKLMPYSESDLNDILAYASHPEVAKFVPWEQHKTLEDSKRFLQFIQSSTSTLHGRLFFVFAIRLKETGRVVGSIDFKNPNPRCGQIDYALGYDYWNRGVVSEAAARIRDWSFENLREMERLQASCVGDNKGSRRVMEKIGMQYEGLRRKAFNLKGQMVDLAVYSLVRE